jgi:hypothetical protein
MQTEPDSGVAASEILLQGQQPCEASASTPSSSCNRLPICARRGDALLYQLKVLFC